MAEIHRRYGDHLYGKHDYDGAMGQYIATIGYLEPSYVIRRFLDAQRIHNLTLYLEALHSQVALCIIDLATFPTPPLRLSLQVAMHRGPDSVLGFDPLGAVDPDG